MAARPWLSIVTLILVGGSTLLLLFVILAGTVNHTPFNQVYFLGVDTSKISGAPSYSTYTLWNYCDGSSGTNNACSAVTAAYPLEPGSNFGSNTNIPQDFLNSVNYYYYLSRVAFAFFIIAVFFSGIAFLAGFLALCSRLGSGLSAVLAFSGLIASIIAAAMMTAVWVAAQNAFNNAGISASIGVKAFAFAWSSVACLLLATIGFCCGCCVGRDGPSTVGGRTGFFRRNRKSYLDNESAVPVNGSF